jgi:hypothetical protein
MDYQVEQGEEIHYVDVIRLYYTFPSTVKFLFATRKFTLVKTVPLAVWQGR